MIRVQDIETGGLSKATIYYRANKLGLHGDPGRPLRFTRDEVRRILNYQSERKGRKRGSLNKKRATVKQICAACKRVIGEVPDPANSYGIKDPVSHGICKACAEKIGAGPKEAKA